MTDTVVHQLTANEIKDLSTEEVAKNLLATGTTAKVCEIPEALYHLFVAPRQAILFANWVSKHLIRLSQEAVPA